jgi:tetratricopeptide (TPR) repeat protein
VALLSGPALASGPAQTVAEIQRRLGSGQALAALELAERMVAAEPRLAAPRFLQGVALMDLQRDDEALALFTAFSQDWPEMADPLNNIALLHARAGRLDQALAALHGALRADPRHRASQLNLAEVHLALAVRAWDQAAASAPLEPDRQRRLQAVRALLQDPGR